MVKEEFKELPKLGGKRNKYFISNYGYIINTKGDKLKHKLNATRGIATVEMRIYDNTGKRKPIVVNITSLTAETFVPNPNKYGAVEHIDGNIDNNHYTNLKLI